MFALFRHRQLNQKKASLATAPPSWQGQLSLTLTVESVSTAEVTINNQPASASVPAQHKRGFLSVPMIKPESESMHIPPHPLNNQPSRQKAYRHRLAMAHKRAIICFTLNSWNIWAHICTFASRDRGVKRRLTPFCTSDSLHPSNPSTVSVAGEHPASTESHGRGLGQSEGGQPRPVLVQWLMVAGQIFLPHCTAAFKSSRGGEAVQPQACGALEMQRWVKTSEGHMTWCIINGSIWQPKQGNRTI